MVFSIFACFSQVLASPQNLSPSLLNTFTNPTTGTYDEFARSVAFVGDDLFAVGAAGDDSTGTNFGVAYLFGEIGDLRIIVTNPIPPASIFGFGQTVAGFGNERFLVGGPASSNVYLFATNGALLATITNPALVANDRFGASIVAVGEDHILIGAPDARAAGPTSSRVGKAYLFTTNGTLYQSFVNPAIASGKYFGYSVAASVTGLLVIGADGNTVSNQVAAGAVFLYRTNGTLIKSINNPVPGPNHYFGASVAVLGSDRVLIGAPDAFRLVANEGIAYLFNTNGNLLTTFTNPVPVAGDNFGWSVASLKDELVLISSRSSDIGASGSGAVFAFSTNGSLLCVITNPIPTEFAAFGFSLASHESGEILVGATYQSRNGISYVGEAYRFQLWPLLEITQTPPNTIAVSWPSLPSGFLLQQNILAVTSPSWSNATGVYLDDGTNKTMTLNEQSVNGFYRLMKQ